MEDKPKLQPNPKTPLPAPELYESDNVGVSALAEEKGRGMLSEAVPLTALTENFSSIPLIEPPPDGNSIVGTLIAFDSDLPWSALKKSSEG